MLDFCGKESRIAMATAAVKKLNLPLSAEMHEALFAEARRTGQPATRLVRSALEAWLLERQRARRQEEIRRFAQQAAGSTLDLDRELERAAAEELDRFDQDEDEAG